MKRIFAQFPELLIAWYLEVLASNLSYCTRSAMCNVKPQHTPSHKTSTTDSNSEPSVTQLISVDSMANANVHERGLILIGANGKMFVNQLLFADDAALVTDPE